MKTIYTSIFILLLFSCKSKVSTQSESDATTNYSYNSEKLLTDIETLSSDAFEGRRTGTKGAAKAKDYIINQFENLKVLPFTENYEQAFMFNVQDNTYSGINVLGQIKGRSNSDKYIVISAHYDHEGIKNGTIYNGADDDASGVSALFAFADYFQKNPPNYSVVLAAFDGEELGLKGSYHFIENTIVDKEQIVLNLNMDMISRSEKNELFAVGTRYHDLLKPAIESNKKLGKVNLLIGHEGLDQSDDWTFSSDHAPFYKAEIPFVYFGVADHADYHKPTDDFERIDTVFYTDAVQTIINVFKMYDALTF
jgi:Zn-dependent M28 family amino/carboxypeptidase